MTAGEIEAMFARDDGYGFARWGRPIVPVVFGVTDETLVVVKGAFEAVCGLAGHEMDEVDPHLGANCMMFFLRHWDELPDLPGLDHLVPDLVALVARLKQARAGQYRAFRFDQGGAIRAGFVFLHMQGEMAEQPGDVLALEQVARIMLTWSQDAFRDRSPLAMAAGAPVLRPDIADLIRAAYDPVLPDAARDPSHALRLSARIRARKGSL